MDKQKQIEEMANELCWLREDEYREIANLLYEAGYRKIPENAVVLTREHEDEIFSLYVEYIKRVRKETAEKFAEMLKAEYAILDDECKLSIRAFTRDIDKVCKEIVEGKVNG